MRYLGLNILVPTILISLLWVKFGESQSSRGEKYAFLVVCSKYNSTQLRDLPYTIEEMEDFRAALLKTGFDADHIILLHDKGERERLPEKAKIEKQFRLLLNGLQANDTVIVAINGHGVHFKGDKVGYYCPLGADLNNKKSLVSMEFFYDLLKKSKAKQKLMIVQACQNDPFVSNDFAAERLEFTEKSDEVPEGIAAIFSCMEGQKSYYDPDRKRGLFFDHVIRSWNGEYLRGESKLDLEEFFRQVRVKTKADALKFRGGVEQVPEVRREYKGEWVLTTISNGWRQLFNGKDLTGWRTHPDNPGNWEVVDGAIVGRGKDPSYLFSQLDNFENLHFRIEAKINDKGNSGMFFRSEFDPYKPGGYEAQINSTHTDLIRTGSLYPLFNRRLPEDERAKLLITERLHEPDEWFTQEIIAQGNRIQILVNGKKTVDYVDRSIAFTRGHLAIQQHKSVNADTETIITVRKVEVKEIPRPTITNGEWVQLFNGKDTSGWKTHPNNPGEWFVKDGILHSAGENHGMLYSERDDYENFHFRIEAKIGKGNSGQYFRTKFGPGHPKGYEAQIDNTTDIQKTGSLYGFVTIKEMLVEPDAWFTQEVIADGNRIQILVNGKRVVDFTDENDTYRRGYFALQHNTGPGRPEPDLQVKTIEVKELPRR